MKACCLIISFFTNRRVLRAAAADASTRPTLITAINAVASVTRESRDKLLPRYVASRGVEGGGDRAAVAACGRGRLV